MCGTLNITNVDQEVVLNGWVAKRRNLGGLIFCVGVAFLFVWLVSLTGAEIRYWLVPLYAIPGALISILGDLTASLIKRYYKIKDYGNLIPGHGGIMDRFGSIWFVSPFVYLMISLFPIFS